MPPIFETLKLHIDECDAWLNSFLPWNHQLLSSSAFIIMASRRHFLKGAFGLAASSMIVRPLTASVAKAGLDPALDGKWFDISLAQWSLHKAFFKGEKDSMRFAQIAKNEFGVKAIEYVNKFYQEGFTSKTTDELERVSKGEGVKNVLIMCDDEGHLGDPDEAKRIAAVNSHIKWIEAALQLGCHSIRVNAESEGTFSDQLKLVADGVRRLSEIGDRYGINVIIENHGGLTSNASWLSSVIRLVDHPRCGTLPDCGNFRISQETGETYDTYFGIQELMPFARGVSAKTHNFKPDGMERDIDYVRAMDIVKRSGFRGYVGIEWEGTSLDEPTGVLKTKALLEKLGGRA
jgi:sugar phosphate isomerase/epimerase